MKKIQKYVDFFMTKIVRLLEEKRFAYQGVGLKYLWKPADESDILVVVLSACTRGGVKARYNYVRTLNKVKCNRLYILDDFGDDKRGAYYLGKNYGNEIEAACNELVAQTVKKCHAKRLIFAGSSKGGWAALNFMTNFPGSIAIVGAPQYWLGKYLMVSGQKICRNYIMPGPTAEKIEYIDNYLKTKLEHGKNNTVYLHYSDKEHTYNGHIKFLIEDLRKNQYELITECLDYTEHGDVGLYFPDFLVRCVKEYVS